MASFAELLADVYELTNRPDLISQTKMAVRSATLKAHQRDYYSKDLFETGIAWATPAYLQSLDYKSFDPRWRSIKYLRKFDASTTPGVAGIRFKLIPPDLIFDDYAVERSDVMYLAGANLEIKSSTQDANMILGYYRHPDTTEASYNSWIAVDHPFCIIFEAAALIFKQTGFDEQAALYRQLTLEQFALVDISNITAGDNDG